MRNKEELDIAVIKLYGDYRETIKKYKKRDIAFVGKLVEISNDESNYTKEDVYYIGFNALLLLQEDFVKNRI